MIVKLTNSHLTEVSSLFQNTATVDMFCSYYLSNLNNFHAYGYIKNNTCQSLIAFYESDEEPAWYCTLHKNVGNSIYLKQVLDTVIEHNENNNRLKFYTLHTSSPVQYWSKYNKGRYEFTNEVIVPGKSKCVYTNHWELLYNRSLLVDDSLIRCNFLKQKYRIDYNV